jgi:uncharacterized protein (DUF885 family)
MRQALIFATLITFLLGCSREPEQPEPSAMSSFVDDYFNAVFEWNPSAGTDVGLHQYDSQFEYFSAAAFHTRIQKLKDFEVRINALDRSRLSADESIDADLIAGQIRADLLDLETLQVWRQNPMMYVSLPGGSIDSLIKRNFAPPAERLRSVIARLKQVPALMNAMRENIDNPPREFSALALRIADGSVDFFKTTITQWGTEAAGNDAALLKDFDEAVSTAASSLAEAATWLEKTLLPKSTGQYAIGPENFSKKLAYEEWVDTPLDELLSIGEANLERDYKAFIETARQIDPSKPARAVMQDLSNDHPTESGLIPDAKKTVEGLIQFLRDKKIVTIASEVRPTIMETPPYARAGTFASMDTPGPYEINATEAFYYVTPPEQDWDAKHKEEHLRLFNAPVMDVITIHEAYPGHYIQFLNAKQFPTKARKLIACGTNAEGWAHYTEQMMIEEGFGNGDPKLRLAQLQEALLRDARYVVGIKLHTAGWTVEQGAKFFEEKAFQEPANAYEESRRGAYNPTYLYYTLGKLQIYKLREDYRKAKGAGYSLQAFHDDFVRQGSIPIKAIRHILLPGNNEPTL